MRHQAVGYGLAVAVSVLVVIMAITGQGGLWAWPDWQDPLLQELRLPRIASAVLVGAALAGSGAALQALFRNPLADPGLIGTSSGAALGVVLLIAWGGAASFGLPLAAFVGGLLSTGLILLLSRVAGNSEAALLLMGLVIAAFIGAITSLVLFLSDDLTLRGAMAWLAGNLSGASTSPLGVSAAAIALALLLLIALGRDLDCLALGTDSAHGLGLSLAATRAWVIVAAALATGAAVALSGVIGFVGMMVPNALALVVGGSRRRLIALSAWLGGLFLLAMDTVSRLVVYPIEIPVGLLTAFTGPPFFIWLFWYRQRKVN